MTTQVSSARRDSTAFKQAALCIAVAVLMIAAQGQAQSDNKPTIVLVHGAFGESASWEGVIRKLQSDGYPVIAAPNPLRGMKSDSSYLASLIDTGETANDLLSHASASMRPFFSVWSL